MALSLGQALSGLFGKAHPATQITVVLCMTAIAIVSMALGDFQIAFIAILAFSPTPIVSLLNIGAIFSRYDLMAVASKANETSVKSD